MNNLRSKLSNLKNACHIFRHYLRWPYPMYKPSQFDSFNHEHTCLASKLTNIELSDICPLAKAGQPFEVARENTCEECKYFCRIHYEVDPEYVTMTLFEMKGSHLFHLEYSVNENMPDDDPAYQSEPDKILRYDIAGGDSFPETMISNTYAATEMTLRRFTSRGDATFHFFYDYGDGWEVVLRLEEVFEDSELPGKELPRVLEGQGFGIIEDCGGPAGLEHLREVFQQKSSPEYQSMREWLGTSEVDLSVFDLQDLNFRLKKLPRIFRDLYEYDYPPTKHSIDLLDRKYCKTN